MLLRKAGVFWFAPLNVLMMLLYPLLLSKFLHLGPVSFGFVAFSLPFVQLGTLALVWQRYKSLQQLHPWSPDAAALTYMRA